jgi:septum formation protein
VAAKLRPVNGLRVYLASNSPRRRFLLEQIGLEPIVLPASVEERPLAAEVPVHLVRRLAQAKGQQAAGRLLGAPRGLLLAADTAVVIDGMCLGKPACAREAADMLRRLSGRAHEVLTGVFLARTDDGRAVSDSVSTRVRFRPLDERTIGAYVAAGESQDKAGAYGIQGRGALLVENIEGSWSNVVGLPLERLPAWTAQLDLDLWDLLLDPTRSEPSRRDSGFRPP